LIDQLEATTLSILPEQGLGDGRIIGQARRVHGLQAAGRLPTELMLSGSDRVVEQH